MWPWSLKRSLSGQKSQNVFDDRISVFEGDREELDVGVLAHVAHYSFVGKTDCPEDRMLATQ